MMMAVDDDVTLGEEGVAEKQEHAHRMPTKEANDKDESMDDRQEMSNEDVTEVPNVDSDDIKVDDDLVRKAATPFDGQFLTADIGEGVCHSYSRQKCIQQGKANDEEEKFVTRPCVIESTPK